jgi:cobalamin biosynthesis protein CobD/CbiB
MLAVAAAAAVAVTMVILAAVTTEVEVIVKVVMMKLLQGIRRLCQHHQQPKACIKPEELQKRSVYAEESPQPEPKSTEASTHQRWRPP